MKTTERYVAYYRVSTKGQGNSGLGLEAQRSAVQAFAKNIPVISEFVEVESGKRNDRPQLAAAIQMANEKHAVLVIAKLDRLSRNVQFIFNLRDSNVDFVAVDLPDANTLTIGIFAVLAQHERELISGRTRAALQAKKAQGFKLGSPQNLTRDAIAKGRDARIRNARENMANRQAANLARRCRETGMTLQAICDELNSTGYRTRRGLSFQRTTIKRLLDSNSNFVNGF